MSSNLPRIRKTNWYFFLAMLGITTLFPSSTNAQCAGDDATLSVCNIPDPANQNINLFTLLNGTPIAGGVWTDPLQTGSLDPATGILNAWNIHISGAYTFIYTVNDIDGCTDNTASIMVTVGGYSGITSPNGSACSDDSSVNLFQFFVGNPPSPHLNGVWTDNDNTGALNQNIFNATAAELGTYSFTYTMPAVGTCPETSSTAIITVHRAAKAGEPQDFTLCETDDMSTYTNLDLFTLLTDEDPNGQWTEAGTSELSSAFDSFINVENIFNTKGPGTYAFTYTVYPTNPVCTIETATIEIIIEELLDLTGATLQIDSDICEDELEDASFTGILTQGVKEIANGTYQISVQISGQTGSLDIISEFINGVFTFDLDSENFPESGTYTISITDIFNINGSQACDNIIDVSDVLNIYRLPNLEDASLSIDPICLGNDGEVKISEADLDNGNYEILYNVSGENNATAQVAILNISSENGSFFIAGSLLTNPGDTTVTITKITNLQTFCTNTANLSEAFLINKLPDASNLTITIDDICKNEPVVVSLSGLGDMTNITLLYNLSGANQANNQSITTNVNSGTALFTIPISQISNTGISTVTLTSLTDNTTTCSLPVNVSDVFNVNIIPDAPIANNATFCEADNATIADLIPNGNEYNWYGSATATQALANTTPLVSGNYYVSQISGTTDCNSERAMISVTINTVQTPTLIENGESFCGADNPTLQDLSANVNTTGTLIWYDALANGNELENTELLQEGFTYYAFEHSSNSNCTSLNALAVTVTLTDCDDDEEEYGFFIPDGFSPNGDGVNETFRIPDIEFLYPNFTLEIYNRYGQLMFKGNKNKPNWDGKNSDSNLMDGVAPNGVYFYIINFNKNNISPKQGRFYLNR